MSDSPRASLRVSVDTGTSKRDIDNLRTGLDGLTKAGDTAARGAKKTGDALAEESKNIRDLLASIDPTIGRLDKLAERSSALDKAAASRPDLIKPADLERFKELLSKMQDADLSSFAASVDPVSAALGRVTEKEQQLRQFLADDRIDTAQYERWAAALARTRAELDGTAKAAKEQAQSLATLESRLDPTATAIANVTAQQRQLDAALLRGDISADKHTQYTASLNKMHAELDGSAAASRKLAEAEAAEFRQLQQLRAQVDPLGAQLQQLAQRKAFVDAQFSKGNIGDTEFKRLRSNIDSATEALRKQGEQAKKSTISAGQLAQANRTLPAQFTDIVVSLQGGQKPLTVLLQQGGQIKDMYGGVGQALKSVASYAVGLINPYTLAAAAVAGLGYVAYDASTKFDALDRAMIVAGRGAPGALAAAQKSAVELAASLEGVSRATAADALAKIGAEGKIAFSDMQEVASVALQLQASAGIAVADTAKEYVSLGEGGVKALTALNDKYNFLTTAQFEHLNALFRQGKAIQAADEAQKLYLENMERVARRAGATLTPMEHLWRSISNAAHEAGNNIARAMGLGSDVERLQTQLRFMEDRQTQETGRSGRRNPSLDAEINRLKGELATKEKALGGPGRDDREAISRRQKVEELLDKNETKRNKTLSERVKLANELKENGASQLEISKALAGFDDAHKERAARKPKAYQDDAATQRMQSLRETEAMLRSQLDSNERIGASEQQLIKFDQQMADLKGKHQLTAQQKSLLANKDAIRDQLEINTGLERQVKIHSELLKFQREGAAARRALAIDNQSAEDSNRRALASAGMGDAAKSQYEALAQLDAAQKKAVDAQKQKAIDGGLSEDQYAPELAATAQLYERRKELARQHYADVGAMDSEWRNGMSSGLANFMANASNVSATTQQLTTTALNSTQNALANFVLTGKASMQDLTASIISDMARIAAQQAMLGIFGSLSGMFMGGGAGAITNAGMGGASAVTGGGVNGALLMKAEGGIINGPGTGTSDSIPAMVSNGEFIVNAAATARNRSQLEAMNRNKYANGGYVTASGAGPWDKAGGATGPTINVGGVTIQANSKEEGQAGMEGVLAALRAQMKSEWREDMMQQSAPNGVIRRGLQQ